MIQYIPKDALLAEIERLRKIQPTDEFQPKEQNKIDWLAGKTFAIIFLEVFLDTIEVKEMGVDLGDPKGDKSARYIIDTKTLEVKKADFSTEVYKYMGEQFNVYDDRNQTVQTKDKKSLIGRVDIENIAKHFFEFGMAVSNPITAADRGTVEEIIINLKRVEQDYRIDLTKEIEWLRNKVRKGK